MERTADCAPHWGYGLACTLAVTAAGSFFLHVFPPDLVLFEDLLLSSSLRP